TERGHRRRAGGSEGPTQQRSWVLDSEVDHDLDVAAEHLAELIAHDIAARIARIHLGVDRDPAAEALALVRLPRGEAPAEALLHAIEDVLEQLALGVVERAALGRREALMGARDLGDHGAAVERRADLARDRVRRAAAADRHDVLAQLLI